MRDVVFVFLAYVEQEEIFFGGKLALEFGHGDGRHGVLLRPGRRLRHAAENLVVDQVSDCRSGSPTPTINLTASMAWTTPMIPGSTPSTPPSAHVGTMPGGGGSGNMQR